MHSLSRALARVVNALRPSTPGKHSRAGLAQRSSHLAPGNIPPAPRRTHIVINSDLVPMVRPYVLVVAEARRNGAVSW